MVFNRKSISGDNTHFYTSGESLNSRKIEDIKGKVISAVILVIALFTFWYMLDLVMFTFILTCLFNALQKKLQAFCKRFLPFRVHRLILLMLSYIVVVAFISVLIAEQIPKLAEQTFQLVDVISKFNFADFSKHINPNLAAALGYVNIGQYITNTGASVGKVIAKITSLSIYFVLAMILSFVLIAEKEKIKEMSDNMEHSTIAFIHRYFIEYGAIFVRTFWKVMTVQVTMALINSLLSVFFLKLMGFNGLLSLWLMIFMLGLIPVAGMFISFIPLSMIAFTIGGIRRVVEVLIMILLLHAIEAYILNPKLMASKTRLPVPVVFIVLLVSEHYLGVWGLIIGVPLFMFIMHICDIEYSVKPKEKMRFRGSIRKDLTNSDREERKRDKDNNYYLSKKYSAAAIAAREARRMEIDNNYYLAKKYYDKV